MVNKNREINFSIDDNHSQAFEDQVDDLQENKDLPALERAHENNDGIGGDSVDKLSENIPDVSPTIPKTSEPRRKVRKVDIDHLIVKSIETRDKRAKERDEQRKKIEESMTHKDELHLFFMSMYELTKKMPPLSQHIVRKNVFQAVSEEEARLLKIPEQILPSQQQFTSHDFSRGSNHNPENDWSRWSQVSPAASSSSASMHAPSNSSEGLRDSNSLPLNPLVNYINEFST